MIREFNKNEIELSDINEYKEHVVAFIDLLGFKHAVTTQRQHEILELLMLFSKVTCDYFFEAKQVENSTTINVLPSISIFSDNVVVSIPVTDEVPNFGIINSLSQSITWFAAHALEKKFIIRGGIAKGPLYHNKNIVFGKALIDAYQLESGLANYPRVLVAPEVLNFIEYKGDFMSDFDGMIMLNYFDGGSGLIRSGLKQDHDLCSNIKRRISLFDEIISENLKTLSQENKLKELSKWVWFSNHYQKIKTREQDILNKIAKANPSIEI
jgi:hypothetical protein